MKKNISVLLFLFACAITSAQYSTGVRVEPILKTDTTSIGQHIVYPNFANSEVTIARVTIPPGNSTGWHKHSFPVFAYVLKGCLTVEVENKKNMQFTQNTAFAEVLNTYHNGTNQGKDTLVLIAIFMGEKGKGLSDHK